MKPIKANKVLRDLEGYIKEYRAKLGLVEKSPQIPIDTSKGRSPPFGQPQTEEQAAVFIQRIWRKRKIRQAIVADPYSSYLSLVDPHDEQRLLAEIMFGRHIAEFLPTSKHRLKNPYIHTNAFYHRDDNLAGNLLDKLMQEFNINLAEKENYEFIPITLLKNVPIRELYANFFPERSDRIIEDEQHSVGFVVLPKDEKSRSVVHVLKASGLTASPWEIAVNIKKGAHDKEEEVSSKPISLDSTLPKTHAELLESSIYKHLSLIAKDLKHPTQKLALCLQKLLNNIPNTMRPEAIQRIACMVDMANTFYEYNYSKFAFSVYATIHEISLSLLEDKDPVHLEQSFYQFLDESQHTLDKALSLDSAKMTNTLFMASPAMSGTNAYMLAMKLALKMKTISGKPPTVKVFKPSYYEFGYVTDTTERADADIFVLSAGPIVNTEGLTPGVDINKFVKRTIIDTKRKKPATLIVDATTALYKNMHLNPEVQQLINKGKLSIIIHESHQKFGMIHTDQAQYGRMFALCAKGHFAKEALDEMQEHSKEDFKQHLDLRIGAYISLICGDTLETIKEQHFSNGALLRNILMQTSLASKKLVRHEDMLANLNELYFITFSRSELKVLRRTVERRDSFGHFNNVLAGVAAHLRLSPNASDNLDCLIQAAQIYLAYHFQAEDTFKSLISYIGDAPNPLNYEQQIIVMALANNILNTGLELPITDVMRLVCTLKKVMDQCQALKGRQCYNECAELYFKLRQIIVKGYDIKNPKEFFKVLNLLNEKNVMLTQEHISRLSQSASMRTIILEHPELSNNNLVVLLDLTEEQLSASQRQLFLDNKKFSTCVEQIHGTINKILTHLQNDPDKHKKALSHANSYFIHCFNALEVFYNDPSPDANKRKILIEQLNHAKQEYCEHVLSADRNASSKAIRYTLHCLVNFIAGFTLGAAHYIHYKVTGQTSFFAKTNSQNRLERFHQKIAEELNNEVVEPQPPKGINS